MRHLARLILERVSRVSMDFEKARWPRRLIQLETKEDDQRSTISGATKKEDHDPRSTPTKHYCIVFPCCLFNVGCNRK